MKNYRIIFTEEDLFMGRMIDKEFSTKWMTLEEAEKSPFLSKRNAKIVTR